MTGVDWFEQLTGFREPSYDDARASGPRRSAVPDRRALACHRPAEMPSVAELRSRALAAAGEGAPARRRHWRGRCHDNVSADARCTSIHNRGALFVASQFNLLEMVARMSRPRWRVSYAATTRRPACAVSAGA